MKHIVKFVKRNSLVEQCHKSKPSPYLKNKYDRLRNSYTNWPSII